MARGPILCLVLLLAPAARAHRPITTPITWNREIVRILRASCLGCHKAGGSSFSLARYDEARAWSRAIREEVLERRMPPWPAARGVGDFANDPSLPPRVIELIVAWVDGGMPLGDPADLPGRANVAEVAAEREPATRPLWVKARVELPQATRLFAATPVAVVGASIEVRVTTPVGQRQEIVFIPSFDRVRTYRLRVPLDLERGAVVEVVGGDGVTLFVSEDRRRPSTRPRE